jgi:hypothetical protein
MTGLELCEALHKLCACSSAIAWVEARPDRTLKELWEECQRGDWMLCLASRCVDRRLVVLAACDIAESTLKHVPHDEERPRDAIEVARRWVRGEATLEEARVAAADAGCAAAAAYPTSCTAAAAYAASHVADLNRVYVTAVEAAVAGVDLSRSASIVRARIDAADLGGEGARWLKTM